LTLVYLGGAWLLGLVVASLPGDTPWLLALIGPGLGIAAVLATRRRAALALGLVAGLLILGGMWRYEQARPPSEPSGIAAFNGGAAVRFRALVSDEPDERGESARIRLSAREVWVDGAWVKTSGGVLLRRDPLPRYRYGDLLEVEGKLETPPVLDDFNYRDYLARQGIGSLADYPQVSLLASGRGNPVLEVVHGVRRRLGDALAASLPDPEGSLAQGILLGSRSVLGPSLSADLNDTSLSHLIAISGYNVTVVAGLVIGSLAWLLGRRQAALAALVVIAAYTVLTGATPSVVRAAIMGGLFLVATLVGRPGSALTAIVLAAALMTAHQPLVVHDVSFQLSFAATVGLVYLSPAVQVRIRQALSPLVGSPDALRRGIAGATVENLAVTLSAIAATLPIIALTFQRISLVAPLANLLVVPAFPLMLLLSGLDAVAGAVWSPLGNIAAWAAWPFLAYLVAVASRLADLPLASLKLTSFGMGHTVLLYAAIGLLAWWMLPRRPGQALLVRAFSLSATPARRAAAPLGLVPTPWVAGGLALAGGLLWWAALTPSGGRLTVTVMDVGQGDAILIESPAGQRILVDGGPSGRAISEALGRETPFWDKGIDLVVLTHPEEDHLNGLVTVLERYDVKEVLASPVESDSAAYDAWRGAVENEGAPYYEAAPGEWFDLGRGARLEVLGPPTEPVEGGEDDLNDNSVVLRLTWDEVSFLLTGDLETAGEEALLDEGADLRSTVLKVAHHGSAYGTGEPLLAAVHPAVAVISVGADNSYGQPSPRVLQRLEDSLVYRTDLNGRVKLSTDGEHLRVEVDRAPAATPAASPAP
jgi:competence protein ComEC